MMVHHGSPLDLGIRNVWRIPTGGLKFSVRCMCFHHVLPYLLFISGNKNGDDAQPFFLGGISFSAPYQTFRLEWCLLNVDWANCLSLWGQATDQAGFMQTLLALTHSGAFQPRNAGLCLLLFWTPTWKQQRRPFGDSSLVRCILLLCSSCALT